MCLSEAELTLSCVITSKTLRNQDAGEILCGGKWKFGLTVNFAVNQLYHSDLGICAPLENVLKAIKLSTPTPP